MSLRFKFLLLILVTTISTLIVFIYLTFNSINNLSIDNAAPAQKEITEQTINKIDRIINEKIKELKIAANSSKIVETTSDFKSSKNIKTETKELSNFARVTGPWNELSLIDLDQNTLTHSNIDQTRSGFNTIQLSQKSIESFNKSISGKIIINENVDLNGKPTLDICIPIRNENVIGNPIIGAIHGELSWPLIEEVLKTITNKITLVNSNNEIIGIGNSLNNNYFEKYQFINTLSKKQEKNQDYWLIDIPKSDRLILTYSEQEGYLEFVGLNWKLISEVKLDTLKSEYTNSLKKLIYLIIPLFLVSISFLIFSIEKIVIKPILELTNLTKKLAEGDFSNKAKENSSDEIGTLSRSFNETSQIISNYRTKIEKEVTDRTKELEKILNETQSSRDTLKKQTEQLEKMNNFMINREVKMKELKEEIKKNK